MIINVGITLDAMEDRYNDLLCDLETSEYEKNIGEYEDFFEFTYDGEPMNLNEKATWVISKERGQPFKSSTHMIILDDT